MLKPSINHQTLQAWWLFFSMSSRLKPIFLVVISFLRDISNQFLLFCSIFFSFLNFAFIFYSCSNPLLSIIILLAVLILEFCINIQRQNITYFPISSYIFKMLVFFGNSKPKQCLWQKEIPYTTFLEYLNSCGRLLVMRDFTFGVIFNTVDVLNIFSTNAVFCFGAVFELWQEFMKLHFQVVIENRWKSGIC